MIKFRSIEKNLDRSKFKVFQSIENVFFIRPLFFPPPFPSPPNQMVPKF